MVKEAILSEKSAAANRRIVEGWLAKTLNLAPEDVGAHMAQADDYASFLRERVTIGKGLEWMRTIEKTWRQWRRTRAHERDS